MKDLLSRYTAEIMDYNLGSAAQPECTPCSLTGQEASRHAHRIARLLEESGRENIVLFGVGCAELADELCSEYSGTRTNLYFCELKPERMRNWLAQKGENHVPQNAALICDISPRAILALLAAANIRIENSVFYLAPGLPEPETKALQGCMQLLQRSAPSGAFTPSPEIREGQISTLAILHPEETGLEEFCAQIPAGVKELVIVWDSPIPHKMSLDANCPVIQKHRNLAGDFAAQRNYALSLCTAPWVLALDGDERIDGKGWQEIKEAASQQEINAFFLQRPTFFPDRGHFRVGFGLWPDYQLRLFRRTAKTLFARPVHEILTGFSGPSAILQHAPLWHLSYVLKNREALEERLKVFNAAMGKPVHRLNQNYPRLPLAWFEKYQSLAENLKYLVFPE